MQGRTHRGRGLAVTMDHYSALWVNGILWDYGTHRSGRSPNGIQSGQILASPVPVPNALLFQAAA